MFYLSAFQGLSPHILIYNDHFTALRLVTSLFPIESSFCFPSATQMFAALAQKHTALCERVYFMTLCKFSTFLSFEDKTLRVLL